MSAPERDLSENGRRTPAQVYVGQFLSTLKDYAPGRKAAGAGFSRDAAAGTPDCCSALEDWPTTATVGKNRGKRVDEASHSSGDAVHKAAASLLSEHGVKDAFKRAQDEQRRARRVRSRKQVTFWTAVDMALETFQSPADAAAFEIGRHAQQREGPATT